MQPLRVGDIREHESYGGKKFIYKINSFTNDKRMRITIIKSYGNWEIGDAYIGPIYNRDKDTIVSAIKNKKEEFKSKKGNKLWISIKKI